MSEFTPKAGEYCLLCHNDESICTFVYIDYEIKDGWFSVMYMPNGGGSSAWSANQFKPLKDPLHIAMAKKHKAGVEKTQCEKRISELSKEIEKWSGVVQVLQEANAITAPD